VYQGVGNGIPTLAFFGENRSTSIRHEPCRRGRVPATLRHCRSSLVVSTFALLAAAGCTAGSAAPTPAPQQELYINFSQAVNGYQAQAMLATGNGPLVLVDE
jgi:hypothetical protein